MAARVVIASIYREWGPTGVQTHVRAVRDYLKSAGYEVELVTPWSSWALPAMAFFAAVRVIQPVHGPLSVWWYRWWHYLFLRHALRPFLAQTTGSLAVYAQCPLAARAALDVRTSRACRVYMCVHYGLSQAEEWAMRGTVRRGSRVYQAIRRFEARTLPALDGIVFVSSFMRQVVQAEIPAVRGVPSIVAPNFVVPTPPEPLPGSTGDLISVGVLEPRKNQAYLLRVLAEAEKLGKAYTLTLVGGGPDRASLEKLARSLGVADRVRFLGQREHAAQFLAAHRAYVHSAMMENLPVALIEAMAAGLPVLAAPVGGIPELFSDGVEGYYWPLSDPAQGARILVRVLDDPVEYARLAAAAGGRFRASFDADVVAKRLIEFLVGAGVAA